MLPPEERDAAYLWEMREAGRDAVEISTPLTFERLRGEKINQLALAKALELIGEAASRVSTEFRQAHPEIEWSKIIGLRHRLVHDYRRINFVLIWDVVREELPSLLAVLDAVVPVPPGEDR